jgi:hypothetical protein
MQVPLPSQQNSLAVSQQFLPPQQTLPSVQQYCS